MPCVCYICADKVQELSDLVEFLKAKLKDLRRIVIESKKEYGIATAIKPLNPITATIVEQNRGHENQNSVSDDLDIKAETEVEMMECDTLENLKDPLALDDVDTGSNFSTPTAADDDYESWNGSDTEDNSTLSDWNNKKAYTRSSSDARAHGNATAVSCETSTDQNVERRPTRKSTRRIVVISEEKSEVEDEKDDSCETSEMEDNDDNDDDDYSSVEEEVVSRKSKRKSKSKNEMAVQKCMECSQEIKIEEMEQHLKSSHEASQTIKCQRCPLVFLSKEQFVEHLFVHRRDVGALVCDLCSDGVKFTKHGALREHYHSAHQIGTKQNVCEECGKAYFLKDSLRTHYIKVHDGKKRIRHPDPDKQFPCTCGKIFTTALNRLRHFKVNPVHKNEQDADLVQKRTACDMCGVKVTLPKLEDHVREHVGEYAVKCPNPNCRYFFTSILAVPRHLPLLKACRKYKEVFEFFNCGTCGFKTKIQIKFRTHLDSNHERDPKNRNFQCPISECTEMFCVRESIYFHLKDKHNSKGNREVAVQKCVECSQEIKIEEMEQHLKSIHQASQTIECQRCPFVFGSREEFVDHLFVHRRDVDALVCDLCSDGVMFTKHGALREHYHSAHQIGTKQYICEECGKAYFLKDSLMTHHLKIHAGKKKIRTQVYRCDLCFEPIEFRLEQSLICHKITVHGEEPFRCKKCGETFSLRTRFLEHEKTHFGIHQKEFKCKVEGCEKTFTYGSSLKDHIKIVHEGVRFCCDMCGKTFTNTNGLKNHVELTHLKLQRVTFVCDQCGKICVSRQNLKIHKLIHERESSFKCTICNQQFRFETWLKKHMDLHEKRGTSWKPKAPKVPIKKIRNKVVKK